MLYFLHENVICSNISNTEVHLIQTVKHPIPTCNERINISPYQRHFLPYTLKLVFKPDRSLFNYRKTSRRRRVFRPVHHCFILICTYFIDKRIKCHPEIYCSINAFKDDTTRNRRTFDVIHYGPGTWSYRCSVIHGNRVNCADIAPYAEDKNS